MLKKELRLGKRKDFEEIKKKGKLRNGDFFSVIGYETPPHDCTIPLQSGDFKKDLNLKFAVIVSKKISKRAVDRNLVRRRIYRIIDKNINIFPNNFAGIFLVKKNILNKSEEELEKCLKKLF